MDRSVKYVGSAIAFAAALLVGGCTGGGGEGQPGQGEPGQQQGQQGQEGQGQPGQGQPGQGQGDQGQGGDQASLDAAAKAEMQGQLAQLMQQSPITFEPDTATLTSQGEQTVQQVAEMITNSPGELRFEVGGFTAPDQPSATDVNQLAQERAQTVVDQLTEAGVPAERLQATGMGPSEPMGDPTQERRAEIRIL